MSRTLRIIDGIIIALFIAAAVLTYVPQVFGIGTTEVSTEMLGNVDVGSIIYTEQAPTTSVQKDDRILNLTDNSASIYTVTSYDPSAGTVDVEGGEETTYKLSANYLRVLAVVPYFGYFGLAVRSTKGLIVLGVILCYVIVSLIVAAAISRGEDDYGDEDDYDDDDEDEFYSGLAEKKKKKDAARYADEEDDADTDDDEDEDEDDDRSRRRKKKDSRRRAKKHKDSKSSDRSDSRDRDKNNDSDAGNGLTEISEEKTSVPGAAADETDPEVSSETLTDVQAALEAALDSQPLNHAEEAPAEGAGTNISGAFSANAGAADEDLNTPSVNEKGEIELAMPVRTADEILSKAYAEGLDPTVEEDKSTGITLVDYSDSL